MTVLVTVVTAWLDLAPGAPAPAAAGFDSRVREGGRSAAAVPGGERRSRAEGKKDSGKRPPPHPKPR
jgi:hypothetical protein